MYTNKEVAKLAAVLGFEKKHMRKGTGIIWNDTTVERLKQQYGIDDTCDDVTEKSEKTEAHPSIFAKTRE